MHERGDEARVGVAWLIFFVWHGVQLLVVGHSRSWSLLGMAGGDAGWSRDGRGR